MKVLNTRIIKYIILLFIFTINVSASEDLQYSRIRITRPSVQEIQYLTSQGIALDRPREVDGSLEIILDNREIDILSNSGYEYQIIIDDAIQYYQDQVRISDEEMSELQQEVRQQYEVKGFEFGSMGGYYTLSEVIAELDSMRLLYPDLISAKRSIGTSHEGHDIWMLKISDNHDIEENEPEILYTAVHHAREVQSGATLIYYMYYLLENYGKDSFVTFLIDNRQLYFVPMVNPDGYYYNQQINPSGGGLWRKNRRDNGDGSWGVDLNRNYGYMWGYNNSGSSPDGSSNVYRGIGPFSEPETQAIQKLCIDHNFKLAFNFHSYWNWIFYPWLYNESSPPDIDTYVKLLANITQYNHYGYAPPQPSNGYQFNGNATDWMYGEQTEKNKIFSMTPEVGNSLDGFWPSQTRIYPLAQENVYASLIVALGTGIIESDAPLQTETVSVSSGYLAPGIDSTFFRVVQKDPLDNLTTVIALIDGNDHAIKDSIILYDDGGHGDDAADDGIFAGKGIAPGVEDIFNVHVYTESDTGAHGFLNNIGSFNTIGPLVFDGITDSNDDFPNPGGNYKFYCNLRNLSDSVLIANVSAKLISSYEQISVVNEYHFFGDINPGTARANEGGNYFDLTIADFQLVDSTSYTLGIELASGGVHYWSDSLVITLYPLVSTHSETQVPDKYSLQQNYPNPFNPITTISYRLPEAGPVTLAIFNIQGQEVMILKAAEQPPGNYEVQWNGMDQSGNPVSTGVYFARLQVVDPAKGGAGNFSQTIKMVYLR